MSVAGIFYLELAARRRSLASVRYTACNVSSLRFTGQIESPHSMTQIDNTLLLYKRAFILALFTILFNIIEGLVSIFFGYSDQSLTLFGFGVDSFLEVISGFGIAHMVIRVRSNPTKVRNILRRRRGTTQRWPTMSNMCKRY